MKKLFISQPMRDKTDEEILAEREKAVRVAKEMFGEDVEVIDSFFKEASHDAPYWYIVGKTLELLTYADVAFFSTGWEMDTGCRIEHICATEYGVQIIGKLDTEVRSNALTKSELDDIETHLIWVQGYYRKRLYFLKQMERRKDSEGRLEYPAVTGIIENLRELDENVEQLLTKIKGLE